ncbi:MAG: 30S ribosomal protein S11 [Candidatus Pacebacteria bacterium]|nr:30S ribosomal protein S11 [Candidatus Paceibacterota bacterium]
MAKKQTIQKAEGEAKKEVKPKVRGIKEASVYITCTYNNTVITLANQNGDVLGWSTSGNLGFKGSKKATPFAASKVADAITQKAQKLGIDKVRIYVKGVGGGRDSAIRSLVNKGLDVSLIKDVTPIPHNGCRAKKPRRI